jgi:hypothetical protein
MRSFPELDDAIVQGADDVWSAMEWLSGRKDSNGMIGTSA